MVERHHPQVHSLAGRGRAPGKMRQICRCVVTCGAVMIRFFLLVFVPQLWESRASLLAGWGALWKQSLLSSRLFVLEDSRD